MSLKFETHNPTGPYKSFDKPYADIFLDGADVGGIVFSKQNDCFKVQLKVKSDDSCGWRNVTLKKQFGCFEKIAVVRSWVRQNWQGIIMRNELYIKKD